jgi:hypothetical protein
VVGRGMGRVVGRGGAGRRVCEGLQWMLAICQGWGQERGSMWCISERPVVATGRGGQPGAFGWGTCTTCTSDTRRQKIQILAQMQKQGGLEHREAQGQPLSNQGGRAGEGEGRVW